MIRCLFFLFSLTLVIPGCLNAQEEVVQEEVNVDDLGDVTDEFKENFFNALAEKAKGNPDRAIPLLLRCLELQPESGAVYFELGKNYLMDNAFAKAETSILTAIELAGRKEWLLDALYDAYDKQQKKSQALEILEELASINPNYEEMLPYKYMQAGRYQDGLTILDKLDNELGEDYNRTRLRKQLERMGGSNEKKQDNNSIANLEQQLNNNPSESLYLKLMFAYGQAGNDEKVKEIAKRLQEAYPESDKAQLALYRIYLDSGQIEKGVASVQRVLASKDFDDRTKVRVISDFLQLADTNEQIAQQAPAIIDYFEGEVENIEAYSSLGEFFVNKKQPRLGLRFYEAGLEIDSQNFDLLKKASLLSIDVNEYQKSLDLSSEALKYYPSQSLFYLLSGVAHNRLNQHQQAIDTLEGGILYLLDEFELERDMYSEMAIAYEALGEVTKASEMRSKVAELNKKLNE